MKSRFGLPPLRTRSLFGASFLIIPIIIPMDYPDGLRRREREREKEKKKKEKKKRKKEPKKEKKKRNKEKEIKRKRERPAPHKTCDGFAVCCFYCFSV